MTLGVFDSGVGGLSVLAAILDLAPAPDFVYLADQAHCPYGPRPLAEVAAFADAAHRFLRERGARATVLACNTASAAALAPLRAAHPGHPFVGMEPAVKPAATETASGVVGVLATEATFQSELFASVVARFAAGVTVLERPCPGLAERIEQGDTDSPGLRELLRAHIAPLVAAGADRLVLGCTHYPWARGAIQAVAGDAVILVDPSVPVARQALKVWRAATGAPTAEPGEPAFFTTGDPERFSRLASRLLARPVRAARAVWRDGRLEAAP